MTTSKPPAPYWNPYVAGIALGLVLGGSFYLSGAGLGGSSGIARLMTLGRKTVAPASVNQNVYLAKMGGGDQNPLQNRMFWMTLGVVAGGFVSGLLARRVKLETYKGPHISTPSRWLLALAGGALMGFGSGLARGCTSGQALSGGAVLSAGSWAFMMMVFAGGYLLAYPLRKLWI